MTWRLDLPISTPLSMNDREHWAVKARRVREVREAVATLARSQGIPQLDHPHVVLHYSPKDKRRRDAENLVPTSKAAVDGLVLAGVLVDDDTAHFKPQMPVLCVPNGVRGQLWIIVCESCRRCGGTGDPQDDDEDAGRVTCARCFGSGWMR